ncbi:MAG TPA: tetratricopeptide repeat protein [Polyangia bacterium]|nr:tetratricopeptide repeat protein [Polyangia bacterium]
MKCSWWKLGRGGLLAVLLTLLLLPRAEAAKSTDKREVEARADFAAGRYQQAIDLFAQLYGETMNATYLRNIGRCQQALNQPQAAINSFREYLRQAKGITSSEREEIEGYIKEMESELRGPKPGSASATAPPPAAVSTALPPAAKNPSPAAVSAAPPPAAKSSPPAAVAAPAAPPAPPPGGAAPWPPPASSPSAAAVGQPAAPGAPRTEPAGTVSTSFPTTHVEHPTRTAGIVVSVVGGALLATGVAFGLAARHDASAVSAQYDPDQDAAGKRDARIGFAADIVGVAAVVTGIVLATRQVTVGPPPVFGLRASALADSRSALFVLGGSF